MAGTLVFPMAATNYGQASKRLQFRYRDETGRWRGGLVVSDPVGKRPGSVLFGD